MKTTLNTPLGLAPMLTVPEVAMLIRKSAYTVRVMARRGALPGSKKLGCEWMFARPAIEKFISR